MSEAVLILPNMRGGVATVGNKVHTLFRLNSRQRIVAETETASAAPGETAQANSRGEPA